MQLIVLPLIISILLFFLGPYEALQCNPNSMKTIVVNGSGKGNFKKIQHAINSIPFGNSEWKRIHIRPGVYLEKVAIPLNKGCIILDGVGAGKTFIRWNDHATTDSSATFNSKSDNILVKGITIENTYGLRGKGNGIFLPAVAVDISGDKTAFYDCSFVGLQDTLADTLGRHYFKRCHIEGAVDFIFGYGQSVYEDCKLELNIGRYSQGRMGSITAQGEFSHASPGGFVFKNCMIFGVGKAVLGRAWKQKSTVIFSHTQMTNVVLPQGWDIWDQSGHEANMMYVEDACTGPGADMSHRVRWEKRIGNANLQRFLSLSFIDHEGWIAKLPRLTNTPDGAMLI